MSSKTILGSAVLAFCIIGMLVAPAAAAPAGQGTKNATIDQGLKDDLWANHQQYRLEVYDMNVQRANSVISILGKYGIDTTNCQSTLATISGKRTALETALTNKDKEGLKIVDADLKTLWQQFRTEMKDAIKSHYSKRAAGSPAINTASLVHESDTA
jgi:hypothetical protein